MAAPRERFRAHEDKRFLSNFFFEHFKGRLKGRRLHMVGIGTKARIAPGAINGARRLLTQPTQRRPMVIGDAMKRQGGGQSVTIELWIMARARHFADINDECYSFILKDRDETC